MNSLIIDTTSIFEAYIQQEIALDRSPQRVFNHFVKWLDSKIDQTNADWIYLVFDRDLEEGIQNLNRKLFNSTINLWAEKNNAFIIKPGKDEKPLDIISAIASKSQISQIVSSDARMAQLLSDNSSILEPGKQFPYTKSYLAHELQGLQPGQIPLLLALTGDTYAGDRHSQAHNIAGQSNSLDLILSSELSVSSIITEAKKRNEYDFITISRSEKSLKSNLKIMAKKTITIDLNSIPRHWSPDAANKLNIMLADQPINLKSLNLPNIHVSVINVIDESTLGILLDKFNSHGKSFGVISEHDNTGLYAFTISFAEGEAFYVPINRQNGQSSDPKFVLNKLKEMFEGKQSIGTFSAYELASDFIEVGIETHNIKVDCASGMYLISTKNHLKDISDLYKVDNDRLLTSSEFINSEGRGLAQNAGLNKCSAFSGIRADVTWRSVKGVYKIIAKENLLDQYANFDIRQAIVCANMTSHGIQVDLLNINKTKDKNNNELQKVYKEIFEIYPHSPIYVNKDSDVTEILKHFNLSTSILSGGSFSVNKEELYLIQDQHPIIPLIQKGRLLHEEIKGGLDILTNHSDINGILKYTCVVNKTLTSRLSTVEPNVHGSTALMRENMVARKGFVLGCFDVSQMELRILAHLSGESMLIEAFNQGIDIHRRTASEVFGCNLKNVTDDQRKAAKAINFGLIYGMSSYGLSKSLNISKNMASAYIEKYFEKLPRVREFQNDSLNFVRINGYYQLENDRRIYFPTINDADITIRGKTERSAGNAPMQATAAELIKRAMIKSTDILEQNSLNAKMILQIHDELIFEIPIDQREKSTKIIKYSIENSYPLSVPIVVDYAVGRTMSKKLNANNDLIVNNGLTM